MRNKTLVFFSLVTLLAIGCTSRPADTTGHTGQPQSFGEPISSDGAVSLAEAVAALQNQDSVAVKVRATVESVCQAKGCWMNLADGQGNELFVQFKDYGFFMPKDIAGREVVIEGYAYKDVTSVEDLRHFAEDEGKSREEIEAITEPKEEIKFMAHGVLLMPATKM